MSSLSKAAFLTNTGTLHSLPVTHCIFFSSYKMAPIRLRHPAGVSTLQVDVDNATVLDLLQEIHAVTQILPSQQELKTGYPPKTLHLEPELPLSSLGLEKGAQIIVNQKIDGSSRLAGTTGAPSTASSRPSQRQQPQPQPQSGTSSSLAPQVISPSPSSRGPDHVETADGSVLVHRIVPDDNSCLFSSVAIVFEQDISRAQQIRRIVADEIKKDAGNTYNEAILGRPVDDYIATILKPSTWGGAIELAVLANHYNTEIASIDIETGRIDHFTPTGPDSGNRCLLLYSGIHYDAATLTPMVDAPPEWHQTLFPVVSSDPSSDSVLAAGKKLADILRSKKAYTNTATFDLKCEQCGQGLKGEKEARKHAEQTGHTRFGEY